MMEVKVEFRSITGAVCDASITRPQSFAEALALAVVGSSSTIASAFSFVKHDMANVALYYNGRSIPKSTAIESIFPDANEGTVLLVRRRESTGPKRRKPVKEPQPQNGPQPAHNQPAPDPHKHLVYGRTREGEDSLLPGYASRPNPSPKSRLLEPSSKVSPVVCPISAGTSHPPGHVAPGPKRKLRFDTADTLCSTLALSAVKQGASISSAAVDAAPSGGASKAAGKQKGASGVASTEPPHKATTETTKAQKKPGKKSNTAPATIDDWGCNLFAGRQSGASEEAMLLMPLPQCMNQRVKLFALLSAVVLWLKFRCIQASWVTVREALRQLQGQEEYVNSSHVLQLSQLCPLLLHLGDKKSLHMSWAGRTRHPNVPDAAAVFADTTTQPEVSDLLAAGIDEPAESGAVHMATTHGEAQHHNQHPAGSQPSMQHSNAQSSDAVDRSGCSASGVGHGHSYGGFLVEPTAATCSSMPTPAPANKVSTPVQHSAALAAGNHTHADACPDTRGSAGHCSQQKVLDSQIGNKVHDVSLGGDFEIHLEDAPRHVPPAANNTHISCKSKGTEPKKRKSSTQDSVLGSERKTRAAKQGEVEESTSAVECAAVGEKDGAYAAEIEGSGADVQDVQEQGLPAFAGGSHARRHAAAFRRCLVQAVALLQEVCMPDDSTEESRIALMREALQRCYPSTLILKPTAVTARSTEALANPSLTSSTDKQPLPSNVNTPNPGLAFISDPTTQQKICNEKQAQPPSQENQTFAGGAKACSTFEHVNDGAAVEQPSQQFSTCLCNGKWKGMFDVSKVTLEQISEAAAVLMAHWESAAEDCVKLWEKHAGDQQGAAGICNLHPHRDHPPCLDTTPLSSPQLLEHLQQGSLYENQIVHIERMPARPAKFGNLEQILHPRVWAALGTLGIKEGGLFEHQVEAITTLLKGDNVTVCTSTASGKSLCYLVPIIQALAEESEACALLMFPTKALAQDQRSAIQRLLEAAFPENPPSVEVYDGDTPQLERPSIRGRARLLVTNPDMLHMAILPIHACFDRFLSHLRYVVVDESHMYRGAFGCHTSAVLRRLQRICSREYATMPLFALTSATSADPEAHACALLGVQQMHVVNQDSSPHGPRLFVLWNPPLKIQCGSRQGVAGEPRDAGVAKGGGPGRKLRSVEEKRAKQETARTAVRTKNNSRSGGHKLGAGVSEENWRQQVAIGRKRGRAGGSDSTSTGPVPPKCPQSSDPTDHASEIVAEQSAEVVHGAHVPPNVQSSVRIQTDQAIACQPQVDTKNAQAEDDVAAVGCNKTLSGVDVVEKQEVVDEHACTGKEVPHGATNPTQCTGDTQNTQHEPRRKRAARMKEVEELLASVGDGGSRSCRDTPLMIGPKPAAGVLDDDSLQSIRKELDTASAAAKKDFKSGTIVPYDRTEEAFHSSEGSQRHLQGGRYGAAGVRLDEKRRSPILEISLLLAECIQHGLRTIAFCKTRKVCELVTSYTREVLKETAPMLASRIAVYRSGYSAAERRAIENALHTGQLCGVAATNALELGIDIGRLDVTLHLSFPGSVASMWQQAGRAGRREQTSLSIYVAFDGPLDQHFMRCPSKLFGAAVETPQALHDACRALLLNQKLAPTPGQPDALHYIGGHTKPSAEVSLRTIDPDRFAIINTSTGETLEEIEASNAFFEVYDGAVYMHHGRPFLCTKLDLSGRVAHVSPSTVRYYTSPVNHRHVHVVGGHVAYNSGSQKAFEATSARVGQALVSLRTSAFVRTARGSQITFDRVDLFLPDVQYMTEAAYIRVPQAARKACEAAGAQYRDSLHAAGHAILNVMPLFMTCNPSDIRTECENPYAVRYRPERLLIYDYHPGGLGLAAKAGPKFSKLLQEALKLVSECDCTEVTGCPGCVQFMRCDAYNTVLHKQGAIIVLAKTLEYELGGPSSDLNAASLEQPVPT